MSIMLPAPVKGAYGIEEVRPSENAKMFCMTCQRGWNEDITPAGRCPWEHLHPEEQDPKEALHEEARAHARTVAGDANDGIDSIISLEDLLELITEAYIAGASR